MKNIVKKILKSFLPLVQIIIFVLVLILIVEMIFLRNRVDLIQSNRLQETSMSQEIKVSDQEGILTVTSASMEIIAVGMGLFTLFGGFMSLINVNHSRELSKTMKKAKRAIRNQRELSANRFLQEGQLYKSRNRPQYARESYRQAIKHGKGTFSALVAEFTLISMDADRLWDSTEGLEDIERRFKEFIKELQGGKHFYQGKRYLCADAYFTLACIYANCALSNIGKCKKEEYAKKANKMFEHAIREDDKNPDIYRNYAAHLSGINKMKKCKKQILLAKKYADRDILLREFMDNNRLISLFRLQGKRSKKEAKAMLVELGINC